MADETVSLSSSDSFYNLGPHREVLDKFREQVSDVLKPNHDDYFLIRWLRARNFDLKKAEDMLRKSMDWRERYQIDQLLTDWKPPEVLTKYMPGGWSGHDKKGCPIFIKPDGDIDIRGVTMSVPRSSIILFYMLRLEETYQLFGEQTRKLGHRVDKAVLIDDLEGFTLKQLMAPGMEVMLKVMGLVEANYPESLKVAYVINAPRIYGLIFSMVKPFLSDYTRDKIVILGSDWKEKLRAVIDADQLPVHWGGTRTGLNGDPRCSEEICHGGLVPESYYMCQQVLVDPNLLTELTVAAGRQEDIPFHISKPNFVLRYYFKTENHDIRFGVSWRHDDGSEMEEVHPVTRYSCHLIPETGVIVCDKVGIYVVHFDNIFSWMRCKKLTYHIAQIETVEDNVADFIQ